MQNTLSIRYAFCACARMLCYSEPSIVFKAKVARHVRILNSTLDNGGLCLATGTIPVSNDFPRALYLWHKFSRVIFIYFCQDLSPLK